MAGPLESMMRVFAGFTSRKQVSAQLAILMQADRSTRMRKKRLSFSLWSCWQASI